MGTDRRDGVAMGPDEVVIIRDSAELTQPGRVYVTGPHFGRAVFSSTREQAKATRYQREDAERLIARHSWRNAETVAA